MAPRKLTRRDHIEAASVARSNLNTFYAVIALLEGGTIVGGPAGTVAHRIVKLCQDAAGKQLRCYDKSVNAALSER